MAAAFLTAAVSLADLSRQFADWPGTAVQWLMTRDDRRAWKEVKSDEQAQAFIDLFWARRDPTPGTPLNEFRREFERRVADADRGFATRTKRGSVTEVGRVYILLGPPKTMPSEMRKAESHSPIASDDAGFGHEYGSRLQFVYDNPIALGLSGPVVFVENMAAGELRVDTQHGNVAGALARAISNAIVSPGLTEAPDWGKTIVPGPVATPREEPVVTTVTTTRSVVVPVPPPPTAVAVAGSRGAHDLALLANARVIRAGEDADPFARPERKSAFRRADDLDFAFVWCADTVDAPKPRLSVSIAMRGTINGEPVNVTVPNDEVDPEPLTKMAGCYLVRGTIPLQSLDPGAYRFVLSVKANDAERATPLEQSFTIE